MTEETALADPSPLDDGSQEGGLADGAAPDGGNVGADVPAGKTDGSEVGPAIVVPKAGAEGAGSGATVPTGSAASPPAAGGDAATADADGGDSGLADSAPGADADTDPAAGSPDGADPAKDGPAKDAKKPATPVNPGAKFLKVAPSSSSSAAPPASTGTPAPAPDPSSGATATPLPPVVPGATGPAESEKVKLAGADGGTAEAADGALDANLPPIVTTDAPTPPLGVADAPKPGLQQAPGVQILRPSASGDGSGTAPDTGSLTDPTKLAALARFAAPFVNPSGQPMLAIVLVDIGEEDGGMDPATLATLPFPVTIAIDPARPDAAARAATYRAAGMEVAILGTADPRAATASDTEVAYQGARAVLPEAVALVATPGAAFQTDRQAAQHMVALVKPDGLGLVTLDSGLNPARQLAEAAGVPHGTILRAVDSGTVAPEAIARALDRAAFEATQGGSAIVAISSRPASVTALFNWAAESKGRAVAGAPVSAVLMASVMGADKAGVTGGGTGGAESAPSAEPKPVLPTPEESSLPARKYKKP